LADLAALKVFMDVSEAQLAKAMLDAHDIPAFLFDEHLGANTFSPVFMSGVRLMVPESLLAEAADLLENSDFPDI
jgi:hypothetical protein